MPTLWLSGFDDDAIERAALLAGLSGQQVFHLFASARRETLITVPQYSPNF